MKVAMKRTTVLPGVSPMLATVVVVSSLALFTTGCGQGEANDDAKPQQQAVSVTLGKAELRSVVRTVDVTGTLFGDQDVTLGAKVPGRIAEIFADVGDRVTAGDALAQIDKTDYELEQRSKESAVTELLAKLGLTELPKGEFDATVVPTVRRAKLQADNAEAKYNRGKRLHDQPQPLISDQDFADLQTSWDVAKSGYDVELLTARSQLTEARSRQAALEIARQQLADSTLRAPVIKASQPMSAAGAPVTNPATTIFGVASRLVSVGEYVQAGTPMFRIVADNPVKLRAAVPERFASQVKVGQTVTLTVESYPEVFKGTLTRINPQIDAASRTFQIEVIVANPERKLQPGAFVRAQIATQVQPNVLFVPKSAVTTFAGVSKVFTVVDGKGKEFIVETGVAQDDYMEITKGMKEATDVITSGAGRLATGMPVTVRDKATPAPLAR